MDSLRQKLPFVLCMFFCLSAAYAAPPVSFRDPENASAIPVGFPDAGLNATTLPSRPNPSMDAEVTRKIRDAIASDRRLSESAEEIRIYSQAGRVTLEGEVVSLAERMNLLKKASSVVGESRVTDRLRIREAE